MRWVLPWLMAAGCALLLFLTTAQMRRPALERDWSPHLSRTVDITRHGRAYRVEPVRAWTYSAARITGREWQGPVTLYPGALERAWLVLEPHPRIAFMAHTLVLFEFEDGALIGLTIEARRERDESYNPLLGALNAYELAYVWATPRDLLTRRAVHLGHQVEIYRLELTDGEGEAYLSQLLARTEALETQPRFYNTLFSNCTNELAKTASIAWHPAFVATGLSARALHGRKRIPGADFEAARAQANMTETIRALNARAEPAFSRALLAALNAASPRAAQR